MNPIEELPIVTFAENKARLDELNAERRATCARELMEYVQRPVKEKLPTWYQAVKAERIKSQSEAAGSSTDVTRLGSADH